MLAVVRRLQGTGLSAGRWVIALALAERKELVAHVSVVAVRVEGGVNRTTKFMGTGEAVDWRRWSIFIIGVGADNDDLKAVSPLTFVGSFSSRNWGAPKGAFEVGSGCRVGAIL